ncbi:NtaA/DmoA family FMN-dependent monooxygenase [Pseudonocardia kongjuensis]|uniref:NtaA/DmoA family FMN-dependent monooxygenase n=1 Tax=Pseudonocardia kongjuensis TaxID=102227 RepID=A0ABN1XGC2_9PSEU
MADMFHLAWFLHGSSAVSWGRPFTGSIGRDWMSPDLVVDMARSMERAGFDYLLIEDSSYVPDAYGGSMDVYLRAGHSSPRQDPTVVSALVSQRTERLGIVPTIGTFATPPYLLARAIGTLDQLSNGRIGWNVVTGSSDRAAQNYGMPGMPEHDERYEIADEYLRAAMALFGSWEPGSVVDDPAAGIFADHTRVHRVDHRGEHFAVRGPLNSGPLPQGRPVIAQAGGSPRGREFGARHADTVLCMAKTVPEMKAFRDDVRRHAAAFGRDPDDIKVLFIIDPVIGGTEEEARERVRQRELAALADAEITLAMQSKVTNIDFGAYDLDRPIELSGLRTNGHQQVLEQFVAVAGEGRTLREVAVELARAATTRLAGTPDSVAARMAETMAEVGGDGFLFSSNDVSRRTVAEITDGLVPALQQRGLVRTGYEHAMFRDNLLAF